MDWDNLQEILTTVRKNKLRTALTAFGVFWGIFMLILLLGAGNGLENGANNRFGSDDRTSIWIGAHRTGIPYKGMPHGRPVELTEDDIAAIERDFPQVQHISAENRAGERWRSSINVAYQNKSGAFGVYGVADDFFRIKKYLDYREGRTLNTLDTQEQRKVALIGTAVRDALFGPEASAVGKEITFHGIVLQVVGVFYDDGQNGRMSERVYIPLSTFQRVFGRANKVGQITLTPKADVDPFVFEENILDFLKQRHQVAPDDKRAFHSFNFAEHTKAMTNLFSAINLFVWFVGLGTLTAGIVGISNIMIITVKDRTREIGVRKALGATPGSIVNMILTESVLITAIAGYLGLAAGVGLLELVNQALTSAGAQLEYFDRPEVDLRTAGYALAVLIVSGALAGLAPALHAARILPIEAMREE